MSKWHDWHDLAPRFYWKTVIILNYFALNGPTYKAKIVDLVRPRIDKPTVYDAMDFLQQCNYVELSEKNRTKREKWNGLTKLYRITPSGLGEVLLRWYDAPKLKVTEEMILTIIEKNPHLGYGAEWIQIFHELKPFLGRRVERTEPWLPWPSVLERVDGVRCLVRTGDDSDDPRRVLSMLISHIISHEEREGDDIPARIRKLLELLEPYPAYAKLVRELVLEELREATAELQRMNVSLAQIRKAVGALPKV